MNNIEIIINKFKDKELIEISYELYTKFYKKDIEYMYKYAITPFIYKRYNDYAYLTGDYIPHYKSADYDILFRFAIETDSRVKYIFSRKANNKNIKKFDSDKLLMFTNRDGYINIFEYLRIENPATDKLNNYEKQLFAMWLIMDTKEKGFYFDRVNKENSKKI